MLAAHCLARMMVYLSKRICSQRHTVCAANGFGLHICTMYAERTAHNTHDAGEQPLAFDSAHSASHAAMLPSVAFRLAHMHNAYGAYCAQCARACEQSQAFGSARTQQVMRQCCRHSHFGLRICTQTSHIPALRTMPCSICRTTHVHHTRTHIAPIDKGDPTMRSNRLDIVFSQRCPVGYPGAARVRRAAERKVCPR